MVAIKNTLSRIRGFRYFALIAFLVVGLYTPLGQANAGAPTVVDQYTEQIPSPGGEKTAGNHQPAGNTPNSGGDAGALSGSGSSSDGYTGEANPGGGESGNSGATKTNSSAKTGKSSREEPQGNSDKGSASSAATDREPAITSGSEAGGMGIAFPLIMVACLLCSLAVVANRRGHFNFSGDERTS
ncbi:MAG TPA: hypothetical protein PLN08_07590 [Solirubrobacterales bacterium]|nr:hypothetical protein [Solirubrobacterales bacterium]HNC05801.1 hypothetical protein [Solirubrobacterales bacterium]HNH86608.1 hypothetical protein [Solirubrobacterales bacterium]